LPNGAQQKCIAIDIAINGRCPQCANWQIVLRSYIHMTSYPEDSQLNDTQKMNDNKQTIGSYY